MWQAKANPQVGFVCAEPFLNGVAQLLGRIESESFAESQQRRPARYDYGNNPQVKVPACVTLSKVGPA